ncbi:hypothetical protein COT30_02470 [Candidatus Micrarchaeota archaeon CG08_land_8_20_14_0_20_49_17]|nr:MAG: hypothetical protein COT30_02470 [Candidatus Micrarchaeota archaeon CG08_land_8_20_14_0_20_49_17]PIZ94159.1 MAG: hypothetical protein COX84_05475 [Candidatus Micrarchaeota archaeon CG_4_10_14_0_2_um_filter_49_7]HII53929.1 hypothetical protein [Candidatus Micrarchaeota archaeon]
MVFDFMLAMALVFIGILAGMLSALLGLHPNTLASITSQTGVDNPILFILPMLVASSFFALIPAIFFSIPDATIVSVLPGKKMFLEGKGKEALATCAYAMFFGIIASIALFPLAQPIVSIAYTAVRPYLLYVLAAAAIAMVAGERSMRKRFAAMFLFFAAGLLGTFAFSLGLPDPLFSVFTGFFALPALLFSSDAGVLQKEEGTKFPFSFSYWKECASGTGFAFISTLLPGISTPAQMATFAGMLLPFASDERKYLAFISSLNGSQIIFSLASLLVIGKARMGVYAQFSDFFTSQDVLGYLLLLVVSALLAFLAMLLVMKNIDISKFRLTKEMRYAIAAYLVAMSFLLNGIFGIIIMAAALLLGFLAAKEGLRKHLMGAIILPTFAYLW